MRTIKQGLRFIMIGSLLTLIGCGENIEDYRDTDPPLKIHDYFNGDLKAWGLLKDFKGKVTRRFSVTMTGTWKDKTGTLKERFIFDDGEEQTRTWSFSPAGEDTFVGKAHDVVGEAHGQQVGNTVRLNYVMRIPVGGKEYDISIDDYLYRLDERRVLNISTLKKFGFTVGSLFIYFEKD